jgi:hypothetical protein
MSRRAANRRWSNARTLDDLARLTADWLHGTLEWSPSYGACPDEETMPLVPTLALCNHAGFVTTGSQPGHGPATDADGTVWEQRAAVEGFTAPELADRLEDAARSAGLLVARHNGATRWFIDYRASLDVTRFREPESHQPQVSCGFGPRMSRRAINIEFPRCQDDALAALYRACQLTVVDPDWGRTDVLFPLLECTLRPLIAG